MNFLFVRYGRNPYEFNYNLHDDLDPVFYGIQSLAVSNPGSRIFLAHSKKSKLTADEMKFIEEFEVEAISFEEMNTKIVSKIDPNNEWLRALNPYEIDDHFYNTHDDPGWPQRPGISIKFKAMSMIMEIYKLSEIMFLDNDLITVASFDNLYKRFASSGYPIVMGQNDYCMNGALIFMNRPPGPFGFMTTESIWHASIYMQIKTTHDNKTRARRFDVSDEPVGIFMSRYFAMDFERLWKESGDRLVDIPSLISRFSEDIEQAIKFSRCERAVAIHASSHMCDMSKGDLICKTKETAKMVGGAGEFSLEDLVREKTKSKRSFVYRRKTDKAPLCSIFSAVRHRDEARRTVKTWANQTVPVEVVVAEFGHSPTIFPDFMEENAIDVYVFCYQPDCSPFAACWWRNVAAWHCSCKWGLQVDCDIALAPGAAKWFLNYVQGKEVPTFIHPHHRSVTLDETSRSFDQMKIERVTDNCEGDFFINLEEFKKLGGWPESYTGRNEITAMKDVIENRQEWVKCHELFCHVPHKPTAKLTQDNPHRRLMPWLRSYSSDGKEWPINGWIPGRINLCEEP